MSRTGRQAVHRSGGLGLGMAIAAAAALQLAAYWPGIMVWDAIRQYGQALSGRFDDWHPPAMEWLWRQLLPLSPGPAPMLLLQLVLYWSGYGLLAAAAWRAGQRRTAFALAACALLPIPFALMGAVLKDCLMAGALLTAAGALAWTGPSGGWRLRAPALLLLVFASTIRFNGVLAALPLAVALLPAAWRDTHRRRALAILVAAAVLIAALPVANRLLRAERSGVELSLIVFDLGGITDHGGDDVFPPLAVADPVAVNRRCYSAEKWDSYAWWTADPCPIGFGLIRATLAARGASPYRLWASAILAHPVAYAEHRLAHFNINSRFLVRGRIERPVPDMSDPNPWGWQVPPSALRRWIDRAARWFAVMPPGWPIWWMALEAGTLGLAPLLPSRRLIVPLAASGLCYGLGYAVLSVASEMRYHLWTMIAGAIAAALAAGDLGRGAAVSRGRLALALMPAVVVTLAGLAWRLD